MKAFERRAQKARSRFLNTKKTERNLKGKKKKDNLHQIKNPQSSTYPIESKPPQEFTLIIKKLAPSLSIEKEKENERNENRRNQTGVKLIEIDVERNDNMKSSKSHYLEPQVMESKTKILNNKHSPTLAKEKGQKEEKKKSGTQICKQYPQSLIISYYYVLENSSGIYHYSLLPTRY